LSQSYFVFDRAVLQDLASRSRERYAAAAPFPHVVLDEIFPLDVADRLLAEFPSPDRFAAEHDAGERRRQGKFASTDEAMLGPFTRHLLRHLNSPVFLEFLEAMTGIPGLLPDPDISHALRHYKRGGCLGIHADFNYHGGLRLDRRLNLIVYLNKHWSADWGGDLELWDRNMRQCVARVAPVFDRCIVFACTDWSFHGFPEPLRCPEGTTRQSLQLYYYTNGRPPDEVSPPHSTLFQWRPQDVESQRTVGRTR
jgi:hypothetical protein